MSGLDFESIVQIVMFFVTFYVLYVSLTKDSL
jgi:hypothetical protein